MMAQYQEIKAQYQDALLFYRMGDFYEMFFEDAVAASEALDIALTKRGKSEGMDIAMCGVPVHSAEGYLQSLIRKGFRVAVCEQVEDPAEARKRGNKSVVARDVVRLLTPGTLTEDALLDARRHNFLSALAIVRGEIAIAWTDISSGNLSVIRCSRPQLGAQVARIAPQEILVAENLDSRLLDQLDEFQSAVTPISSANFDSTLGERRLREFFNISFLDAFGEFTIPEISALGAIVIYLELTQKGKLPKLRPPTRESPSSAMQIDAATRRNLEITIDFAGGRETTLLSAIDRTLTGEGARLLASRLSAPAMDIHKIQARQQEIGYFLEQRHVREQIRKELRHLPDMNRSLSRLCMGRGGPRDMAAIRNGLVQGQIIHGLFMGEEIPPGLSRASENLSTLVHLADLLSRAIVAEPPTLVRDGNFVVAGYSEQLDNEKRLRDEARGVIAKLQKEYADFANVPALKIKFNNVLGYFVETSSSHADRMLSSPLSKTFVHRQSTVSAVRFTTSKLSEIESRIINAADRALEIETSIFSELRDRIENSSAAIASTAHALARIDLAAALADVSELEGWCRPIVDEGGALEIVGGRHPVVEQSLRRTGGATFVPNDCALSDIPSGPRICLLTGPNMGGKSTYLRQNALIALLAQAGSYVPAESARIGLVSQLFSRVGAADELARGRSTFMVEMVETAAILNQADKRALVILDEIGRGTATYDGLSIAWATLEHLHEVNQCRTLFATHYHELTRLADSLARIRNSTVSVREWNDEIIFLHEVRDGSANRSYGVQVAKLAGIPPSVIARSREILEKLETAEREGGRMEGLFDDLPLFSAAVSDNRYCAPAKESELEQKLQSVNPDELSPIEALSLVYDLKKLLD